MEENSWSVLDFEALIPSSPTLERNPAQDLLEKKLLSPIPPFTPPI